VYDGGDSVYVPPTMGTPRADQMHGTPGEQLVEISGRVCYDSLGTGRNTPEYHKHLLGVKHYSVHEHVHFTVEVQDWMDPTPWIGIPDVVFRPMRSVARNRFTFNLRHALEWPTQLPPNLYNERVIKDWGRILQWAAHGVVPNLVPTPETRMPPSLEMRLVRPETDRECFVSLFLEDSLVWSHEQVRHRFNMSQRSGRFCDQTDREYAIHPLLKKYLNEAGYMALNPEDGEQLFMQPTVNDAAIHARTRLGNDIGSLITQTKMVYEATVDALQKYIGETMSVDATTARKQARSAGRYYLGQGLSTEMIFTASVASWRGIFEKRVNPAADAAIHELMSQAKDCVLKSRYGQLF